MIDLHAHLFARYYEADLPELVEELDESLERMLVVGIDRETSEEAYEMAVEHDFIYAAAGVHPHEAKELTEVDLKWYEDLLGEPEMVGLGEIGLDYYHENRPREQQSRMADQLLGLARKVDLPVILHVRPAKNSSGQEIFQEMFSLLDRHGGAKLDGIFHCFAGDKQIVEQSLEYEFYYSVAGNITYNSSEQLRKAVKQIPPERIFAETDSPYLAPAPRRGDQNRPDYVKFVYEQLAEIYNIELDELRNQIRENSRKLLNWF